METTKLQELQQKVHQLEETLFYIDMVDRWTKEDSESYEKYYKQLNEVKQLLIKTLLEEKENK